jgi:hypothetical protein
MIAVVHRGGREAARMLRVIAAALAGIAIAILINLITTPPLPGWLRWLKPGWPQVIALVIFVAASILVEVLARRADKTKPSVQPLYDENSTQYRQPRPPNMFEHRVGLFNASEAEPLTHVQVHLVDMSPLPRHRLNNYEEPFFPYALPMASGGDKSIGISLPPGREELWLLGTTTCISA